MKNSREVCFATRAGYAEFNGLPGKFSTGCPNTPAYKSRYCTVHLPITVAPKHIQFSEDGTASEPSEREIEERHAAIITNKRVTRSSSFYKVSYMYYSCRIDLQINVHYVAI